MALDDGGARGRRCSAKPHGSDDARLRAGTVLLDALYEYFRRTADEREVKP
jgi:hypothetical protein